MNYIDLRDKHPDYKQQICPNCGVERWFKHSDRGHWVTDQWNCQFCGKYLEATLEYPCPECDIRMVLDGWRFKCRNETCGFNDKSINREELINRLSSDDFTVNGMPGIWAGDCPICEAEHGIDGGPDGELECSECHEFYAGQYSGEWFCYAIWLDNPDTIRVNPP